MLTLEQASPIVDKALEKGRELGFRPRTVVVFDRCGGIVAQTSLPTPAIQDICREDPPVALSEDRIKSCEVCV